MLQKYEASGGNSHFESKVFVASSLNALSAPNSGHSISLFCLFLPEITMMRQSFFRYFGFFSILFWLALGQWGCNDAIEPTTVAPQPSVLTYWNQHDSAYYTGKESCRDCHYNNYLTYHQTGMGKSFGRANPQKSASIIGPDSVIYNPYRNFWYQPFWKDTVLMVKEFRLEGKDTVYQRIEKVDYIVGSGHHTNSHIFTVNGYAYQIPFTFYTQQQRFDLPPGFEGTANTRFSRYLGLECISCHNGLPTLVLGSQNKYSHIPLGIDCERCHGPGSVHVNLTKRGVMMDTAVGPDLGIVNPIRLPKNLQNDICSRCHLQGTMVLKNGKSFYDFRPGLPLTDFMDVFMPVYEGGTPTLIMASHFERMAESVCYKKTNGDLSCIQCHNPHLAVQQTDPKRYNKVCTDCHNRPKEIHSAETASRPDLVNCVDCHLIKRDSRDIPHVLITDHKISLPDPKTPKPQVFKGLVAVNNRKTDRFTMGRGYLREYETFEPNPIYLDSAAAYLLPVTKKTDKIHFKEFVHYFFLTKNHRAIRKLVESNNIGKILNEWLVVQDYENDDAWAAYRIGQAFESDGYLETALRFFHKAAALAPFHLEMLNKLGSSLVLADSLPQARKLFARVITEYPRNERAWVNNGFCELQLGNIASAQKSFEMALSLNPDNVQALVNLAGLHRAAGRHDKAVVYLQRAIRLEPQDEQVVNLRKALRI